MTKEEQYDHLVEMVARARVLSALSSTLSIIVMANETAKNGLAVVVKLGCTHEKFNGDTIKRYMELTKGIK